MIRNEAHNKVIEWIDDLSDKPSTWHYGKVELHRDIDRIFDSLESRKCSNCRFSYRLRSGLFDCDKIQKLDLHKDFCCNKWAEK